MANKQTIIRELVNKLSNVAALRSETARDNLLTGIPGASGMQRDKANLFTDLTSILQQVSEMGELDSGESALDVLQQNILALVTTQTTQGKQIQALMGQLNAAKDEGEPTAPSAGLVFVNRQDEQREILSNIASPYFMVHGPSQFGKTTLLQMLRKDFPQRDYICGYVKVDSGDVLTDVVKILCDDMSLDFNRVTDDISLGDMNEQAAGKLGAQFGSALYQVYFRENIDNQGAALLIDDVHNLEQAQATFFLKHFIPMVIRSLSAFPPFFEGGNRFRVVASQPYIDPEDKRYNRYTYLPFRLIELMPFDYNIVLETIRQLLPKYQGADVDQIPVDLLFSTGGHPGCIISIMEMYNKNPTLWDIFYSLHKDKIWSNIVQKQIRKVKSGIHGELLPIFERLSIFRVFNYRILDRLLKTDLSYPKSFIGLSDDLTKTHLYLKEGRKIRDAITRRLLMLERWHTVPKEQFRSECLGALDIYKGLFTDSALQNREVWVAECFFQYLQSHYHDIGYDEAAKRIKETLFGEVVKEVLDSATQHLRDDPIVLEEEINVILRHLVGDWELQFLYNLVISGKTYQNNLYNDLLERIKECAEELHHE